MTNDQNIVNNNEQTERIIERIETPVKLNRDTLIPLGLAMTLIAVIISGAFWMGSLSTRVDAMDDKDSPTRQEFNQLCTTISSIDSKLTNLNDHLLGSKN